MFNIFKRKTRLSSPRHVPGALNDSLDVFGSERSVAFGLNGAAPRRQPSAPDLRTVLFVVAIAGLVSGAYFLRNWRPFQVEAASASLTIESVPAGAEVLTDGVVRGRTPLTLSITPGEHAFELLHEGRRKSVRTIARAGAAVVHHVEFDAGVPDAPKKASLRVTTEPANLRVSVDGVARGKSPLTIEEIEPGTHRVQVFGASRTLERSVKVGAGEAAAVIIASPAPTPSGPAAGWLTVTSPVTMQIVDDSGVIGTSASSRIMLTAGRRELRIINEAIGFSQRRTVQIAPGATQTIKVELPSVPLSLNALPWAEVWVDGKHLGETPIGNYQVRLGPHDVVFRHPELGERRLSVIATTKAPARVSVDMRKPGL